MRAHEALREEPVLVIEGLVVQFGALKAVDEVNITIPPGGTIGLIGPNGAGKTTLINAISGFVQPTSGTITLNGKVLTGRKAHQRARQGLGRTFQNLELFSGMSVLENVMSHWEAQQGWSYIWHGAAQAEATARAHAILQSLQIGSLAHHKVTDLSYADRKMVEFARAIMVDVALILLDEPAAGISLEDRAELVSRIKVYLGHHKIAALVVEHDMEVVRSLCETVYVMDAGRLIAKGKFEDVMNDHEVKRAYLG